MSLLNTIPAESYVGTIDGISVYARKDNKHARFYNKNLRLVSAAQCARAAVDDGSNTVPMSLQQYLVVTRAKVAAVAEIMKTDAQGRAATDADDRIT
ncbi:hypothetical protein N7449_001238 [Penicillium cf. viridicatum]|uniref:Uncharacterized protein n=1 Tax=Penicillium cf. viridicatum TaxID=2972119 RepID=A0A9W9T9A3_9EURO|nr:hypothetical protein N7449_001238 [Penicillium cf. viridicatum]